MKRLIFTLFVLISCTWANVLLPFSIGGDVFAQADFSFLSISVKDGSITGTTEQMQYAITAKDTSTLAFVWQACEDGTSYFNSLDTGNYDVHLRDIADHDNDTLLLQVSPQLGVPNYIINFIDETAGTLKKTDIYSWNADLSDSIKGDGSFPIHLVVDSTLDTIYIQTAITDTSVASLTQKLYIPERPATPTYTIDYTLEQTNESLGDTTRWSKFGDFHVSAIGSGFALDISSFISDVQDTLFFEHQAIDSKHFKSNVGLLIIKPRLSAPNVTIDFQNELTSTIPDTMEWSENGNMNPATSGLGTSIDISAYIGSTEDTLFFRNMPGSSFASLTDTLLIPKRPLAPTFTINYANETTIQILRGDQERSTNADLSSSITGSGSVDSLIPGQDVYYRDLAIPSTSFSSDTFHLPVKARPVILPVAIDFVNETLISLPSEPEWDTTGVYTDVVEGVDISPSIPSTGVSNSFHVRQKSIDGEFASLAQEIVLPPRDAAPSITDINDTTNLITWTSIAAFPDETDYEYSTDGGSNWTTCSSSTIDVGNIYIASGNFQLRIKASDANNRFAGNIASSTLELTTVGAAGLTGVALSVKDEQLSGTSSDMQYAIMIGAETDTSWLDCDPTYTDLSIEPNGNFKVFIRQKLLPSNKALVKSVPAVAGPPSYSIDYFLEKTKQIIPATDEYTWEEGNFGTPGGGLQLNLTQHIGATDSNLYIRTRATADLVASQVQTLNIPARPSVTAYAINYDTEKTNLPIPPSDHYSYDADMSSPQSGTNDFLALTPGIDVYFQTPYREDNSFKSNIHHLVVIERPTISFSVDFTNQTSNEEVPSSVEWSKDVNMSSPTDGGDIKLVLEPGTNIWLQQKFTESTFRSDIFPLSVPAQPAAPETAIDYVNETLTNVNGSPQWDADGSFGTVFSNQDLSSYIENQDGENKLIHVKYPASTSNFESFIQEITLVKRHEKPTLGAADDNLNTMPFTPIAGFPNVADYEYTINGGAVWQSCSSFTQNVGDSDIGIGQLQIRLKASNTDGVQRFAGEPVASSNEFTYVGTTDLGAVGLDVEDAELYGTTPDMEYAIDNNGMGAWTLCSQGKTVIPIDPAGDFTVHIRQASQTDNTQMVTYVDPAAAAPTYAIDFISEKTTSAIPFTVEYSWDTPSFNLNGAGVALDLSPYVGLTAKTLYLRHEATESTVASLVQTLDVPARAILPEYSINHETEQTNEIISSEVFYSNASNMAGASAGPNAKLDLTPGQNIYFQQPAGTTFKSTVYELIVPEKPTIFFSIDYVAETSNEIVPSDVEYATNVAMTGASDGTGVKLNLTPGSNLWFRKKASTSSFASDIFPLTIPARPTTPNTVIDYLAERLTLVPSSAEWDASGTYQALGDNQSLSAYIPSAASTSTTVNIRVSSNGSSFASTPQVLPIPKRSAAPVITAHDDMNNTITFSQVSSFSSASSYEYSVNAGDSWQTCSNFTQDVGNINISAGDFKVRLKASTSSTRFAGEMASSNFQMTYIKEVGLNAVDVIVSSNLMTGTEPSMEFALETSGIMSSWNACQNSFTPISISTLGNVKVWVRQAEDIGNTRLVKTIPAAALAPNYTINFENETTNQAIPPTTEYTWLNGFFGVPGSGTKLNLSADIGNSEKKLYLRTKADFDHVASLVQELLIPARPTVQEYTIDFETEKTNQAVSADVEYSTASNMTNPTTANGSAVTVTPGVNLYFRKPATNANFKSEIYELSSPTRPTISYDVNYINETTVQDVPSSVEWANNIAMTGAENGPNTKLDLTPGTNIWLRKKASLTNFASDKFALVVKARPSAPSTQLNYLTEQISSVPANCEWDASGSFVSLSNNQSLSAFIPASSGTNKNVNVRIEANTNDFASENQLLELKKRELAPLITGHDDNLNTISFNPIGGYSAISNYEYSVNGGITWSTCNSFTQNVDDIDIPVGNFQLRLKANTVAKRFSGEIASSTFLMTEVGSVPLESVVLSVKDGYLTGTLPNIEYAIKPSGSSIGAWTTCKTGLTNIYIDPEGDFEVYVRQASNTSNSRLVKTVPAAAPAPDYSIDYSSETTLQSISSADEYTWTDGLFGVSGTNAKLDISSQIGASNKTLYIRTKATINTVASKVKALTIPPRPTVTAYSINYPAEQTNEAIASNTHYSTSITMAGAKSGTGSPVSITPGVTLYFQIPAGTFSFASDIYTLTVKDRPSIFYSVDFVSERTFQTVENDVQWATNASMNNAKDGSNSTLALSPGQDIWFRKKASSNSFKSATFTLNVPSRPSPPSYSLDFVNERTNSKVPTSQEWATQSSMIGATSGSGDYVPLAPSTNYYFRKRSTSSSFASESSEVLVVPARPIINYGVDYINARTSSVVPSSDLWSTNSNMTPATTGTGARLELTPGTSLYFQRKAVAGSSLASEVFTLNVPSRPSTPEVLLDYVNEKTNIVIPSSWEWSNTLSMTGSEDGPDDFMTLLPGKNYYFRKKASNTAFASDVSARLSIPSRPSISFSIDYINESTNEALASNVIYANNASLNSPSVGGGNPIKLTPGMDMWFKQTAVPNTSLASSSFKLVVPERPAKVNFEINYLLERTKTVVSSTIEWSNTQDMLSTSSGTNNYLALTPSTHYYFRKKASNTTFASEASLLEVPARPSISYSINYIQETTNQQLPSSENWSFSSTMTSPKNGDGSVLSLSPGVDIWFQKPAISNTSFASKIFHLQVPNRPSRPSFSIDYLNEQTKEDLSASIDWSYSEDMTSAKPGTNSPLELAPSTSYYFRKRASVSSFASEVSAELRVPARPIISFSIDYSSESTNEIVPSAVSWSNNANMIAATSGTNAKLSISPGINLWFQQRAIANTSLASAIYPLSVPARPTAPQVEIEYETELLTNVPPSCQWDIGGSFIPLSNNTSLSTFIPSYGSADKLVNIKVPSSANSFESTALEIELPARDMAPQITGYNDLSIPNKMTWTGIAGYNQASDYEYNINNTSWDECDSYNQDIPADIEILRGNLSLRLAASDTPGKERFAGEQTVSTQDFSGEQSISLSFISINLISGQITGTSSKLEYSLDATDWDNGTWFTASDGNTNVDFDLAGGFFVMIRQKDLENNRRLVAEVKLPADAPVYGINYFDETLDNPLLATDEMTWNSNLTGFVAGDGVTPNDLNLTNSEKKLYIRTKLSETVVPSKVQVLTIPAREQQNYSIDFDKESTAEKIGLNVEYAYNNTLSSPLQGEDKVLELQPNQDVWFRRLASDTEFASAITRLIVPGRFTPSPIITIDYANLSSHESVSDKIIYWEQTNPDTKSLGDGEKVVIQPGVSMNFRHVPDDGKFASEIFELAVPFKPEKPAPVINYVEETLSNIATVCEWKANGSYQKISEGESIQSFIPDEGAGENTLPIRLSATSEAFASNDTLLILRERPPAPTFISYDDEGDSATWEPVATFPDITLYEYSVNRGASWTDCNGTTILLGDVHIGIGDLQLRLKADGTLGQEHFAGSPALSNQLFTAITLLSFENVKVNLAKGIITGTTFEMEYSLNSTLGLDGNWHSAQDDTTHVEFPMGGGYKVHIRQKGKESNFAHLLNVAFALPAPEFTINFKDETLTELIWDTVEIARKADMSDAIKGPKGIYELQPGIDSVLYLRYGITNTRVPSAIQRLRIPHRAAPPVFTIDFWNEASNEEVSSKIEWSEDKDMLSPLAGAGYRVSVNPKEEPDSIYFRYRASDTSFVSELFILEVPALTPKPEIIIDYIDEKLSNVPANCQWNITGQFQPLEEGQSIKEYIPASNTGVLKTDVRIPASATNFASGTEILRIPARPKAPVITDYNDYTNTLHWEAVNGIPDILAYELSIDSGATWQQAVSFNTNIGDTIIGVGRILIRVAASNEKGYFEGDIAQSKQSFSKSEAISFEAVRANIKQGLLVGTTPSMEYSITSENGSDGEWFPITSDSVHIDYPASGGFKIYARQADEPRNFALILDVALAAAPPAYSVDFLNERINKPFAVGVNFSWNDDMSNSIQGDGLSLLKLHPVERDSFLYIQTAASESTVPSNILTLKIPARPAEQLDIDFENETTQQRLNQLIVWSTDKDFTFQNGGTNERIPMIPGVSIWYRQLASGLSFVSDTFKLESPIRPVPPMFSIDYLDESTVETVDESIVYADNDEMLNSQKGPNLPVNLSPGQDLWFAIAATDTSYASEPFKLNIPARPEGPVFASIDYETEELKQLNDSLELVYEYEEYPVTGSRFDISEFITIQEGVINVRYPSDGVSYFASESYDITIAARPELPNISLVHVVSDQARFEVDGRPVTADAALQYQMDGGAWHNIDQNTLVTLGGDHSIVVRQPSTTTSFESFPSLNLNSKLDAQLIDMIVIDDTFDSHLKIGGIQHYKDSHLQIFTRWGQKIYDVTNYTNEFDFRDYPAGTYYYLIAYTDENGVRKELKSFVEVIKKR